MRDDTEDNRDQYISELFGVKEDSLLFVHDTAPSRLRMAQLGVAEGRLLQLLISISKVKTVVEVGTCVGFSAICMAKVLPRDGHLYTIEKNVENAITAENNINSCQLNDRVTVLRGDAREELKKLEHLAPFDMMFIDANKASYCHYLDWANQYIRKGGLIVADNALLFDTVFEEHPRGKVTKNAHSAMVEFNKELSDEEKYLSSIFPTKEGLLVALKLT